MLCGMVLAVIPALLLLLFDDSKCLGHESEGLLKVGCVEAHCTRDGNAPIPYPTPSHTRNTSLAQSAFRRQVTVAMHTGGAVS